MALATSVYVSESAINNTANELKRIQESKRDFIAQCPNLQVTPDMRMVLDGTGYEAPLPMQRLAKRQLQDKLGLYTRYEDKLLAREDDNPEFRDLLVHNYNELLRLNSEKMLMVRTLDNKVRAVLSNSYRVIDNADLFFLAAAVFQNAGARICRMRLWDDGFEMFALTERFFHEIKPERPEGLRTRIQEADFQYPAVRVYNSETGRGKLGVDIATLTSMCVNLNVFGTAASSVHLGSRNEQEGRIEYQQDTLAAEGKAIALKLRDAISSAFDESNFRQRMSKIDQSMNVVVRDTEKAIDNVVKTFELGKDMRQPLLKEFYGSGDLTQYGLAQAVSWLSHQLDEAGNAELASSAEEAGGTIMTMEPKDFKVIDTTAVVHTVAA